MPSVKKAKRHAPNGKAPESSPNPSSPRMLPKMSPESVPKCGNILPLLREEMMKPQTEQTKVKETVELFRL
jgi:hypothetical protein